MATQSERLERETSQARARLSTTVDQLRGRMTPGQLVDQLADYAREGPATEFFHNLAREIRENPLPLTLIGIGVAWLIVAGSRSSAARQAARERTRPAVAIVVEPGGQGDPEAAASSVSVPVDKERPARPPDVRAMERAHEQH